jgi:hypothetical protein
MDPLSLNRFAFVEGNPLRYTDPSGHCPFCLAALGVGIIALGALMNPTVANAPGPLDATVRSDELAPLRGAVASIPGVSDVDNALAGATGVDPITGDELSPDDRLITVGAALVPGAAGAVVRKADSFFSRMGGITRKLRQYEKAAYRAEARQIFKKAAGGAYGDIEIHHRIPLEWAHLFPDADPNRLANLVGLDASTTVHDQIDRAWLDFRMSYRQLGRDPTASEVLSEAMQLDEQYGTYYIYPSRNGG